MFKFNFQVEDENEGKTPQKYDTQLDNKQEIREEPFREHKYSESSDEPPFESMTFKKSDNTELEVDYVISRSVIQNQNETLAEVTKDSDLVTGIYEGGLKIWECSLDLATYLASEVSIGELTVIELGCGAGLPGIVAGLLGAKKVDFQDYNDQVIEHITMPNVARNLDAKVCQFFSGDWKKLETQIRQKSPSSYDLILTSETIYNTENYEKLITLFDACLKPTGKILLAAKIHYFGVGGGLRLFEQSLKAKKTWKFSTVKTFEEGVSREILEISRI